MALCSNSTSLLSLAFGLNAVYAALATHVASMRTQLAEITVAHFKAVDPSFAVTPGERAFLESWVSRTFNGYKVAVWLRLAPLLLSISLMGASAGTLYQNAIWDKCFIEDTTLARFIVLALFVAPAGYFGFGVLLTRMVKIIEAKAFKNNAVTLINIDIYRSCLKAHNELEDIRDGLRNIEKGQAEIYMSEFRESLSKVIHPLRTISEWVGDYRVRRLQKKYLPDE